MTLLCLSSSGGDWRAVVEQSPDASGEIALETALGLALGLSVAGAAKDVFAGWCMAGESGDHHLMKGAVEVPVAAAVEPKRVTCPLLAGNGLVPARAANAASNRIRPG